MQSKTSLGNVNSLHAHLFFAFFRPGLSTLEYRKLFSGFLVPHDRKETKLKSSKQYVALSVGKNTKVVLVPYLT